MNFIMPVSNIPKVSVIVPTYNREELLCNTIKYLLDQDFLDYEILIIDQTTKHTVETVAFFENLPSRVKIINHQPPSLTAARNRGIHEAKGDIIIMVDDDVILKKDFISQHLKYYDDKNIVGVTGRVELETHFKSKLPSFLKSEFLKWTSYSQYQASVEKDAYLMAGCNHSFRKAWAYKAGLYDENFTGTAWGEDYDFSLRLKKGGYKIIYSPHVAVFHLYSRDGGCGSRHLFDTYTIYSKPYNMAYLIEKHRLSRLLHLYFALNFYIQLLIKKDYLIFKRLHFFIKGNFYFIKGLLAGFKKGRKKALTIFKA